MKVTMLTTTRNIPTMVLMMSTDPFAVWAWPLANDDLPTDARVTSVHTITLPWWWHLRSKRAVQRKITRETGFIFE